MRGDLSETYLIHDDHDLLLRSVFLLLHLMGILVDSLNALGGRLLRTLEVVRDEVRVALEKVLLRESALK